MPLGQIDLPVTFGDPSNYRTKTFTFKVVGLHGTYHAILGRPCYAKFIAIPNYTYLKLKLSGPCGVITISTLVRCFVPMIGSTMSRYLPGCRTLSRWSVQSKVMADSNHQRKVGMAG